MIEQFIAIAKNTFTQSIRQPIYLVLVGLGILALVFNLSLSSFTMGEDNRMLMDMGLATIFLVCLFIAAFVATSVLSQEIQDKTVLTVVSKPVSRPLFIFGKFFGVSGSILVATIILSCTFMLTLRHEVMSRASDELDWPVIIFGIAAILLAVGISTWCNYFYNWVFTSTTIGALLPLSVVAWLAILVVGKDWKLQMLLPENGGMLSPDLNVGTLQALFALFLALLVMCSIAIAASARLGQVMTIFICILVFFLGLLSDHFFGRRAFVANSLARITEIEPGRDLKDDFNEQGNWYTIRVAQGIELKEGMTVDIAADPLGLSSIIQNPDPATQTSHIQIRNLDRVHMELVKLDDTPMKRPPREDDYLLASPPNVQPFWRILWGIPPDLQFLILIDPLTQGHVIPFNYLGKITIYSLLYVIAMLCLAVILFQTREVG